MTRAPCCTRRVPRPCPSGACRRSRRPATTRRSASAESGCRDPGTRRPRGRSASASSYASPSCHSAAWLRAHGVALDEHAVGRKRRRGGRAEHGVGLLDLLARLERRLRRQRARRPHAAAACRDGICASRSRAAATRSGRFERSVSWASRYVASAAASVPRVAGCAPRRTPPSHHPAATAARGCGPSAGRRRAQRESPRVRS